MIGVAEREFLLDAIYEYSDDIFTINDLNLKYVACNRAFLSIVNQNSVDEVVGKTIQELHTEENAAEVIEQLKKVIETKETRTYFLHFKTLNSEKVYRQTSTPIIKNGIFQGVLSVTTDVTHEEHLKEKLIERNNQFHTLLENLPMLVYMKDTESKLTIASEAAHEFVSTGVDRFHEDVKIDLSWMAGEIKKEDGYVIQSKKQLIRENCAQDVNGKSHWYRIHKAPILNIDNEVEGLVTIAQNINKEKESENKKNLFLATLTHDLKNPLQAQISSLELFYQGVFGSLTDTQKEMLEMIIESSKYMRTMLCSLMQTCRDNNGVIYLEKQYFDIDALMQKCIKESTNLGNAKNVTIKYESEFDEPLMFYADEVHTRRVIGNLLNNAFNYALNNTEIEVKMYRKDNDLYMDFENFSEPIPDDLAKIIFDKYVCGNSLQGSCNVGLGLYFCKKVVKAHEGSISLKTHENKSIFTVKVPFLDETTTFISEIVL